MDARDPREKRKLEHSPLVLVLTEVKFAPILAMASFVPDIQDKLRRNGFPGFVASMLQQIQLMGSEGPAFQTTSRWVFTSKDGGNVVSLTTDALSLQTTKYDDFEAFLELFETVVGTVEQVTGPSFADRVGLRYVDAIPDVGTNMSDFFNESVLSFSAEDLGVKSLLSNQQVLAETERGHLLIRMNQVQNAPLLPPDLNAPEFASLTAPRGGIHAILDIDSSDEGRGDFTFSALEERLWAVHKHASSAFWKSVTEKATTLWGMDGGTSD